MELEDWMTITEAAAALNVSRASVYNAIAAGKIRTITALGKLLVLRADVAAYEPRAYTGKRENSRPPGVRGPGGRPARNA